jgi:hypothetical protein
MAGIPLEREPLTLSCPEGEREEKSKRADESKSHGRSESGEGEHHFARRFPGFALSP